MTPTLSTPSPAPPPPVAGAAAWFVPVAVITGIFLTNLHAALAGPHAPDWTALAVVCLVLMLALQLVLTLSAGGPGRGRRGLLIASTVIGGQACLVYLPALYFQHPWMGIPGYLAGSVLFVLSAKAGWLVFIAVAASVAFTHRLLNTLEAGTPSDPLFMSVQVVITGLIVYGLSRFRQMLGDLRRAQRALAEAAVVRERLRFAKDLHDLMGYGLSAMVLKAELVLRLVPGHPDRARTELDEILDISRRARADLHTVAHGHRDLSLEEECRSVSGVLAAAGVRVRMDADGVGLPPAVATAVATVLREGTANVLRHSAAENCEILLVRECGRVTASIVNDGVGPEPDRPADRASGGLVNLSERAAALGGGLVAGRLPGGRFRLAVELPVPRKGEEGDRARDGRLPAPG
ncbi:histidine kinase [Nocardiopsis sp. RSe5-2]|uniref:Histidine kinase n=1 Tax=Nocardiopsis endophytica TaxID=3018445 RepID=A0ABT4U8I3_9ACTN|nr:histidine kinase [Nocardiopsis endophytica]MDA2813254.1 histidine kinase [Nocardiopsis endophytica]